jgi:signal transduction histidine kinase
LAETEASRLTPEGREVCAEIERSGQRLSSMVDALAICSRTERQTLALGPVALQPLVEAIFASAIAAHQTRFPRLSLDPALPEIVSDTELLTAILRATVDNAIRYNSSNPPRVHVGVEAGDDTAEITVVDNGATLTELERGAVFELFTRLAPRQSDGVGAGLTIARMAARRLGGELRVEPAPQGGNSFILSLPILDADSPG